jgi:hypothetical protein
MYLKGRKFEWLFIFIFFHSVDNEIIVSFKFFQRKIIHLYIYVWNFTRNPVETPKEMSNFHLLEGRQIWMTFYFYFFHSVENEKIVSFKFFQRKITHSFVLVWNFKRNLVETPNEMPHFRVLEGLQIWMTFYFNFFHSVDNEIIVEVSSSIGRKLYIRTYSVEIQNETPLKPQMKYCIFMYLKGRKFEWLFFFFQSLDNEIIVSFKFFRKKITHSFVLGWNFNRNPVETLKEMSHFHLLEGQQIWMTFYIYLFRGVDNEIIVSFKFFRLKVLHSYLVEISNETSLKPQMKCRNFMFLIGRKVEWLFFFLFFFIV